jgi:hypothetical protein
MRMLLIAVCAVAVAVLGMSSLAAAAVCSYNMQAFSEGTTSCQNGRQFRCSGGKWESVGTECADADPGDAGVKLQPGVNEPTVREPVVREPSVKQPPPPTEPKVP